jgi:hypothetical protein
MNIGDNSKIGFIIGERTSRDLRIVDVYVGGVLVTYYDNKAYVPQFIHSIECEASDIENRKISDEYLFLNWGPTTDDVSACGEMENDNLRLTCELRNGKLIEITLPIEYVVSVYREAASELRELHA